jgi:hypothetical protein
MYRILYHDGRKASYRELADALSDLGREFPTMMLHYSGSELRVWSNFRSFSRFEEPVAVIEDRSESICGSVYAHKVALGVA